MSPEQLQQRAARLSRPLAPAPCGEDARTAPPYEAIRAEVAKLEAPGAPPVDWAMIAREGDALLATLSKDLLIAAYTAQALLECEGPAGLLVGLLAINDLLERHWDELFPAARRLRARRNALDWLIEKASRRLSLDGAGVPPELSPPLAAQVERLAAIARDRFGDEAPAVSPLRTALERAQLGATASPAPHGVSAAAVEAPAAEVAASPAAPVAAEPRAQAAPSGDDELDTRVARWLDPISPAAPAGADARYEPAYERVRAAVKRLEMPSGQPVDWKAVLEDGDKLLREQSKDLLIGSHVAYALYDQRGLSGLVDGLCLMHGLLSRFWDELHPGMKRGLRARANAVAWLVAQLQPLGERVVSSEEREVVRTLERAAARLCAVVDERFDDPRPALGSLRDGVARLAMAVAQDAAGAAVPVDTSDGAPATPRPPATAAAPSAGKPAQPSTRVAVASPGELSPAPSIENRAELTRFYTRLRGQLWDLSGSLRQANPRDPLPYRLGRIASYLTLVEPPAASGGKTMLPPPPSTVRGEAEALLAKQQWEELLALAEGSLRKSPYLLDLHRFVDLALQGLGAPFAAARRAVTGELASLLARVPELPELQFQDGSPFATDSTRRWLASLGQGAGAQESAPAAPEGGGEPAVAGDEVALAAAGKTAQALEQLERSTAGLAAGRQRFLARLRVAQACADGGGAVVAAALYDGLLGELDRHGLEAWEPALASECLAGYHRCLHTLARKDKEMAEAASVVYRRLCRLDPKWALSTSNDRG